MALLLDTGVLYALADADDAWHQRCVDFLERTREILMVPVTVVPEVTYLLRARPKLGPRAEHRFVQALAHGELDVQNLTLPDMRRCAALLQKYPDVGFVDASVVAVAERLHITTIATTDRRHFGAVRPKHVAAFDLAP